MSFLKMLWGLLFRLFPCPTKVGLRRVGRPDRNSPVLVTCNFYLTVNRLTKTLERSTVDAWLLVADSKGVNVWCAAGGDEFNTHSVVSAVKTSGIGDLVDHWTLILPPLGAPGIVASEVRSQTGWSTQWGPVRMEDLSAYLRNGFHRDDRMKRATYSWKERVDTALGCLFPIYFLGALGVFIFARHLVPFYLLTGAATFLIFFSFCPWIPAKRGITKAMVLCVPLLALFVVIEFIAKTAGTGAQAVSIIAMITLVAWGLELGGLASTMPSDLDPFLARLGIGGLGNVRWAGTVRTELLCGYRVLVCERDLCIACGTCHEVCPMGVWEIGPDNRAVQQRKELCTACRACLIQCPSCAIQAVAQGSQTGGETASKRAPRPPGEGHESFDVPVGQDRVSE